MRITKLQKEAMRGIKDGADVYSYSLAKTLREVEKANPSLLVICKAMNAPKNGALRQPYFGAILTDKGRKLLSNRRRQKGVV